MYSTSLKLNCKALICAVVALFLVLLLPVRAYAYTVRKIPSFWWDGKNVFFAEGVAPRSSSLSSVSVSYDILADLVYYCNEHGLSTSLFYNTALSVYVGFVNDSAFKLTTVSVESAYGLLCNSDGKVYVAERPATGGNSTTNNTYNFNQTIINNHNTSSGGTATTPSVSSSWTDRNLQEKIYQSLEYISQCASIANGYLSNNGWIEIDIRKTIQQNVVPAIEAVNNNLISFKDNTLRNLNALYTITEYDYVTSLSQLDVLNRLYSGVTNIGARLDSVISNGMVQINTSSIDARLDKLISMYSKVNSVVLDTAAINGGQIKAAVGGELKDVMFWGSARRQNPHLLTMPLNYTLSDAPITLGVPELRSIPLGASIPAYISADPVLAAGVWKSGSTYYLSDTYNASTGEYVQRIKSIVFDGSENWVRSIRANDASLFSVSCIPDNTLSMPMWSSRYGFKTYTSAFDLADDSTKTVTSGYFSHYGKYIRFQDSSTSLDGWKKWLSNKYKAGEPLEVWYALAGESVTTYLDLRPTIAILEGDSTISADMLRITAKYETYDSYTQTADIINAINNLQVGVLPDLDPIVSRLDTIINKSQATVVNVVTNNTYLTNVYQLDDENDVADRSKEGIEKVSGVFKWLWKHAFKDAFGAADVTKLDGLL